MSLPRTSTNARRNLLLYNTLRTFTLSWILVLALPVPFTILCTFPGSPFIVLLATGLVVLFGLTNHARATEELWHLYPHKIHIDIILWQHVYQLLPPIAIEMGQSGNIGWMDVLFLRGQGIEPELWSIDNRPDDPRVVWERESRINRIKELHQAERKAAFEAEWATKFKREEEVRNKQYSFQKAKERAEDKKRMDEFEETFVRMWKAECSKLSPEELHQLEEIWESWSPN